MTFARILLFALIFIIPAAAQAEDRTAAPVAAVESEPLQADDVQNPVVLELFSSQACVFCPKADALMGDLSAMNNVIGLTCHVDYYDVEKGSLARPFCTKRQSDYAGTLHSGPAYTPQMVINGAYDVVGYHLEDISRIIRKAAQPGLRTIGIDKVSEPVRYRITLPSVETPKVISADAASGYTGVYQLWIAMRDKPHSLTVAEGANKGLNNTYYNVVSDMFALGTWDGHAKTILVDVKTLPRHESFVVLAQKPGGEIVAVGRENLGAVIKQDKQEAASQNDDDDLDYDLFGMFE